LQGRTACGLALDERDRAATAAPLGEFLAALHSIGPQEAIRLGAPLETLGRLDPVRRIPQAQEGLDKLARVGLISSAAPFLRIVQDTATSRPTQASALVHGDFYVRHILIGDGGRPCGIIDWGDIHLGDVALDLSVVHTFLPPSSHDTFRHAYGPVEETTWRLARFRALQYGIHLSDYGHATGDRDIEREGLTALKYLHAG
jgi:aminoglycoside phosphotransferase (APT) family kinase protein